MGYLNEDGLATLVGKVKGQVVQLTSAEYRNLPDTKLSDNKTYFVTDEDYAYAIDDEPTLNSDNLVKSGGVYTYTSKIGSGTLTTTAQTIIPAINELKNGLTNLSTQIGGVKNISILSTGESRTLDILFTDQLGFFRIECMNRRASAKPFSAIVQKYSNTTNYVILSDYATDASAFTCSNISGGIRVTLPFTYAGLMVSSGTNFTLSVV